MTSIVVLASGRGSNFEAIAEAVSSGRLDAKILALVCDQAGAPVLDLARKRGIPAICVPKSPEQTPEEHERLWLGQVRAFGEPEWLVLAGYMRILSEALIQSFELEGGVARIVNVHPSLLPAFPGRGSYRQAYEYGARVAGVSVHLVTQEVDGGPICAQEAFDISGAASAEAVEKQGLEMEHRVFPEALRWILARRFSLERTPTRRTRVRQN